MTNLPQNGQTIIFIVTPAGSYTRAGEAYSPVRTDMRTVTIVLPSGYESPEAFAKDCGFELAEDKANTLAIKLAREVRGSFDLFEPLARQQIGNTNFTIIVDAAEAVLAHAGQLTGA